MLEGKNLLLLEQPLSVKRRYSKLVMLLLAVNEKIIN